MKKRPNRSYGDDVADRWVLPLDLRQFQSHALFWEDERIGLMMKLVYRTWLDQVQLPASLDDFTEQDFRSCNVSSRRLRKHYDAAMVYAIRALVAKRAPLYDGERDKIFDRSGGRCSYCGGEIKREKFQVDHVVPVSRGGLTHKDNLVASCGVCNMAKGASHGTP